MAASSTASRARVAGLLAPLARLFGPQTSSGARERRDMLVLLLAVAFVVGPHFGHLPWWATALLVLMLFWRVFLTITQHALPGRMLMLPLLAGAGFGVYLQHGTLVGQEAGVTFLLLLMALKLLEMRARRDIFVVIFLSFFILLTQFMRDQGLPVAAMSILAVAALFFVLVSVHLDEADLPARRKLRIVAWSLAKAVPLTIALFLLFPRVSGPLWGMPGDASRGSTGLSNTMAPGSISRLLESPDIAFRARFDGEVPVNDLLYWRGPVLGAFNGRAWTALSSRRDDGPPPVVQADRASLVEYTVTLEPHRGDWILALDTPAGVPAIEGLSVWMTSEMQLVARDLVRQRVRYSARSYTRYRMAAAAAPHEVDAWLDLPAGFNPRTQRFAEELARRAAALPAAAGEDLGLRIVRTTLEHFRTGGYTYTLTPPRLARDTVDEFLFDTRQGYCEHYASAFVVLMRNMGLPARVVTGYQGGERNPVDGFLTVRQSDAHAWAEVWVAGRGWLRVDPTAVVAPARIERGAIEIARLAGVGGSTALRDFGWLRVLRYNWEAVQNSWHQWVLSYSQDRQRALVGMLGLAPRWESVAVALAVAVSVLLIGMALSTFRPRPVRDPLGDVYRALSSKLADAGVPTAGYCGPRELAERAAAALGPDDARQARSLLSRYERMRYSPTSETVAAADIRALRRAVRGFRPSDAG